MMIKKVFFSFIVLALLLSACSLPSFGKKAQKPITPPTGEPVVEVAAPAPNEPQPFVEPPVEAPADAAPVVLAPAPVSDGELKGPYAVILLTQNKMLNMREKAGVGYPIVDRLDPHAVDVMLTGKEKLVDGRRWVKVRRSSGSSGWVNAHYLTAYVDPATFCVDANVNTLLADFKTAMTHKDGKQLASLVSPTHGMFLSYLRTGRNVHYTPDKVRRIFAKTYGMNWGIQPTSGLPIWGSFRKDVLPTILDVLNSDHTQNCNTPTIGSSGYQFQWPFEYQNINYYALYKPGTSGTDLDWRTWLVGVEYVNGRPYILNLLHLFWEP